MVSTALPENTLDALKGARRPGVAEELGAGDYEFTTKSGVRTIEKDDKVRVALDYLTAEVDLDTKAPGDPLNIVHGDLRREGRHHLPLSRAPIRSRPIPVSC